ISCPLRRCSSGTGARSATSNESVICYPSERNGFTRSLIKVSPAYAARKQRSYFRLPDADVVRQYVESEPSSILCYLHNITRRCTLSRSALRGDNDSPEIQPFLMVPCRRRRLS